MFSLIPITGKLKTIDRGRTRFIRVRFSLAILLYIEEAQAAGTQARRPCKVNGFMYNKLCSNKNYGRKHYVNSNTISKKQAQACRLSV